MKKHYIGNSARVHRSKACASGKHRYRDEIAAKLGLAEIQTRGEVRAKTPTRAYHCGLCSGWHLTSQEKRTKNDEQVG